MTDINLLPWRPAKREKEKKLFIGILIAVVIASILLLALFEYYSLHLINNQMTKNKRLNDEILIVDRQINDIKELQKTRLMLMSRMKIVQKLQSSRPLMVHLFDELIKVIPPGIVIIKMEKIRQELTLWGYSDSHTTISLLMRNIADNQWLKNPELMEIKKAKEATSIRDDVFKLRFKLVEK